MSIKKLFSQHRTDSRDYSDYADDKTTFDSVESSRNASEISIEKNTFVPQVDYSQPHKFAKFGSAELYYSGAMTHIIDYYPYDGSDAEKNKFYNGLMPVERYIFDKKYPRFNGYGILSATGWGTGTVTADGYGQPNTKEYIIFKGGPHGTSGSLSSIVNNPYNNKYQNANIYDTSLYTTAGLPSDYGQGTRESNLRTNFDTGVTVEFWLKKDAFNNSLSEKEVVFDLWNSGSSGSAGYGRLTLALTGAASGSPFIITAQSGTVSASVSNSSIGDSLTTGSLSAWHHYAFRFYNTGSNLVAKLYVDGNLNDTNTYASNTLGDITSGSMLATIGALVGPPSGSTAIRGDGKLSGSIDDFRFWKASRNSEQISVNYFDNVGGGSNTDISNTTLGVYYKFNEGITTDSTIDSTVLDYSGRISNGVWVGYGESSRNTGSAIVLAGAATKEYKEPVVRAAHPDYITLNSNLITSGSNHDVNNNSSFLNYAPSWVLDLHDETENKNLKIISHMVGAYMDKMYLLAAQIPTFKQVNYTTASHAPIPFASHLPTSLGLYVPDLFVDATILENLSDRTKTEHFESKLNDTKNLIYLNLYNNLTNIYKSKGTEKAIRNVMRCFNLDDELISIKVYNNNSRYTIKDNLKQTVVEKTAINFDTADNNSAIVYQRKNTLNSDSSGFISGSQGDGAYGPEEHNGATAEVDIIFPKYLKNKTTFDRDFITSSIFGIHTVDTGSTATKDGTDTTFLASDLANFQVLALRDKLGSKNVYFKLTSSYSPYPLPELTSSTFFNVYDDSRWNLSVRIKPKDFPIAGMVSSSLSNTYDVIFRGVNTELGVVKNTFELSSTIVNASGSGLLRAPKRLYVGASRTNLTGAVIHKTDIEVLNARYWTRFINTASLDLHSFGKENSGIQDSYMNISPIDVVGATGDLTNKQTLALNWTFNNVTSSTNAGTFTVQDYSSGSSEMRSNYGWLGTIAGFQHSGYGYSFATSSTSVVEQRRINSFRFIDPEQSVASDMISILTEDDEVFGVEKILPSYTYSIEKNMYDAISSEMINFFAGAIDFNQLVGAPVNRYRDRYKEIEKLREAFFKRVTTVTDVEKFIGYYKWFDDALSTIIKQLMPASIDGIEDVNNVIESHVLERNKYQTKFPTLESRTPEPAGAVYGRSEASYPYAVGFSPPPQSPRDTNVNEVYWKNRAERSAAEISSGDAIIDAQRETFRKVINTVPFLSSTIEQLSDAGTPYADPNSYKRRRLVRSYIYDTKQTKIIKGGINFTDKKNIHFTLNSLHPAGKINTESGKIVPQNVLLSFMSDLVQDFKSNDPRPENIVDKRYLKVLSGKEYEEGLGYSNLKSSMAFPFNIISSSNLVNTGYQKEVYERLTGAQIQIVNLHNDVYGPDMEVPMQGPFTDYAVGGHQSRHIRLSDGTETWFTRPEAWRIMLGTCTDIASGAIGMVGPDYPNNDDYIAARPYPDTRPQKAIYYRDHVAKRPVNFKNIRLTTGSTILGNYRETYEYVQTVGAYSNPRHFVNNQPVLPPTANQGLATSSTSVRTILDVHRTTNGHIPLSEEYSTSYLTGAANKSVIISRFSAPGGIEVQTRGYQDIRASEFSVYGGLAYRNLSVLKPSQGPSGTISTPATSGDTTNIQVYDIHGKDYGLYSHLARHTARFGRDSLFVDSPGASYNELPGFHKVHRNNLDLVRISGYVGNVPTYATRSSNDNFSVQHQIPRSSKQYAWITQSLVSDNGWLGFTPENYLVKGTEIGLLTNYYTSPYSFLSSSEYGSYHTSISNERKFGQTPSQVSAVGPWTGLIPSVTHLNLNVHEPITSSTNVLGYPSTVPVVADPPSAASQTQYLNTQGIIDERQSKLAAVPAFNALMFKRGNQYGFPSWKQLRQDSHPIVRDERINNKISIAGLSGSNSNITIYDLPPISNRGRPNTINFQVSGASAIYTIRSTAENEKIYYNSVDMNNRLAPSFSSFSTPDIQLMHLGRSTGYLLNWVIYSQQLFPSIRNEFLSSSTNKTGYDNLYWRDSRTDRNTTDTETSRFGTPAGSVTAVNSAGIYVAQSSWPLDAPNNFLSRTEPILTNGTVTASTFGDTLRFNSQYAGELQNPYLGFLTGAYFADLYASSSVGTDEVDDCLDSLLIGRQAAAGALYARKHIIPTPISTRAPYGPSLPYAFQSSSMTVQDVERAISGNANYSIDIGGGEAYWDAPTKAGYVGYDQTNKTQLFILAPSEPWFNDYDDFKYELKLAAKGFAVIPEYRISENLTEYENSDGGYNPYQDLGLELPHTSENSRVNDKFYITYSNSEFLQDFLKIKNESLLNATEIMVSCTGAIRFNPYKGFYPAQRTLDLVSQFKDSHYNNVISSLCAATSSLVIGGGPSGSGITEMPPGVISGTLLHPNMSGASGLARPFMTKMFSPGLMFNTIKSGMAVDYPIVMKPSKISRTQFKVSKSGPDLYEELYSVSMLTDTSTESTSFFDKRLPFETLIEPKKHLQGLSFYDMEAHPSASMPYVTCSWVPGESDESYNSISRNFFGAVPSFFLKDQEFASIKSEPISETFRFGENEVYMMRVKMERSTTGPRVYTNEVDGLLNNVASIASSSEENVFTKFGAKAYIGSDYSSTRYFPVPQDPRYSIGSGSSVSFKETFTMFSRPSAFGPDLAGRPSPVLTVGSFPQPYHFAGTFDSISGFNPAYTPAYTNGEAWCDLVFRPTSSVDYNLEKIMAECKKVLWRFDAGRPITGSMTGSTAGTGFGYRSLIYSNNALTGGLPTAPYDGKLINSSSMQIDASLNLFGIETTEFTVKDRQGLVQESRPGTTVGKRWVIRPKFETPMMNFSDSGLNPISGSTIPSAPGINLSLPANFGGESVPHGMWHQYGIPPEDASKGIFISIEDVPKNWLQNHYDVIENASSYNNGTADSTLYRNVKSLADLVGFNTENKKRLGELKENAKLREAVVAIPYITQRSQPDNESEPQKELGQTSKFFISIPQERYKAAQKQSYGTATGDSFETAGSSLSKQLQKMDRYVFPPQLDFINNPENAVDPFVMYIFEFEYDLDKSDLSYIWQNIAPRDYKKMKIENQSIAHELMDAELLNETVLEENQNLRWMIFKVKQKGQDDYWDYVDTQAQENLRPNTKIGLEEAPQYQMKYNWPYDYVSFVEMAKINVDIKYSQPKEEIGNRKMKKKNAKIDDGNETNMYSTARGTPKIKAQPSQNNIPSTVSRTLLPSGENN